MHYAPARAKLETNCSAHPRPMIEKAMKTAKTKPLKFAQVALNKFDPIAIAQELLTPRVLNDPIRSVLLSGFLAWVVRPTRSKLRRRAMRVTARRIYVTELEALLAKPRHGKLNSTKANIETFRKEVIEELDREKVIEGMSRDGFLKDLASDRNKISIAHHIIDIWLICIANSLPKARDKLSLQKAADTIEELGEEIFKEKLSERKVRDRAKRFGSSISFSYSASRVAFGKNGSLLDAIFENRVTLQHFEEIKVEWFSLAQAVSKSVLEVSHESYMTKTKFRLSDLPERTLIYPSMPDDLKNRVLLSNR
jgi:hypothetical protein